MESAWQVLLDLLILLTAALLFGTVAEQLRQSAVLGYLVAGTLVGPNVLKLVHAGGHVEVIAELGVALLLFSIGLEFSFQRLRRLGRAALLGGTLQVSVTLVVVAALTAMLGLTPRAALAVGAIVALSSTACALRVLIDRAALDSIYGRNALGILLLQDVAVIPLMLLMVMLTGGGSPQASLLALLKAAGVLAALVACLALLLNVIVPRLLNINRWSKNRELPILLAVVLAVGSAVAAHQVSHITNVTISPAMGAFLAGVLLATSPFAVQIRADVAPLRTLLVTLFFAAIGMVGEPLWALQNWHLLGGAVIAVLAGKAAIVWMILRLLGTSSGMALATGLCVAQVGEFSFVLAGLARGGAIDEETFRLIVSTTIATLFLTPFLVALAPTAAAWAEGRRGVVQPQQRDDIEHSSADLLIIGFGPAGQTVAENLQRRYQQRIAVLDLNPRNAAVAGRYGLEAQVGDASRREVLEHFGVGRARVVIITVPDPDTCRTIIHQCRAINQDASVIARSRYHARRWELQFAGAEQVIDEEEQVGLRLAAEARRHVD